MQHLRSALAPPSLPITNQLRDHPSQLYGDLDKINCKTKPLLCDLF